MVFSSNLFLLQFLPIVIVIYYSVGKKYKNLTLVVVSLLFYAWGEPVYIMLMLLSILMNYCFGIFFINPKCNKKLLLLLAIIGNISFLAYYKYSVFFLNLLNYILKTDYSIRELALPIGISFYTFQALSYIVDLYRGEIKAQRNIINLALYISFFPQLIAGPIVKYREINNLIDNRVIAENDVVEGIRRFCYGLGKKILIANTLAKTVDFVYGMDIQNVTGAFAWIAVVFYTFQIYYDFSGYSDMAIGLGKMFGFSFRENFDYPYTSTSVQEFWRKWHISLSAWFRDYIYIPLGGNRKGEVSTYINLIIVFLATGLWHGAGITFVMWGLYHGSFVIAERIGFRNIIKKNKIIGLLYTFCVVNFGWVLFRSNDIFQAFEVWKRLLNPLAYIYSDISFFEILSLKNVVIFAISILGCGFIQKLEISKYIKKYKYSYGELILCMLILLICISCLANSSYNPFIYFRF